ncbi:GGDEF domain-containing protein [Anaerosporobacter faecicola]|uniref:GGDEF domain-containing protein n=1 Tax=Anaerosporobacter faecicola TaxID=2718714 RepID=UPI001438F385|nr:GGDEF domain-containing protein [Anaerosporobacter faecicola]
MTEYKAQIVCIAIVVLLLRYYIRNKQLHTVATTTYRSMVLILLMNLVFDIITVYTVNHLDTIPIWINSLTHRIFIYSLDVFIFLLFWYLFSYVRAKIHYKKLCKALFLIPIVYSFLVAMFGRLYFIQTARTNYSQGPVVYTVYFSCGFYVICMLVLCIRFGNSFRKGQRKGIIGSVVLCLIACLIQVFFPTVLMSGAFETLILFNIFLSLENPGEYVDKQTYLINQYGFFTVLEDRMIDYDENLILSAFILESDIGKKETFMMEIERIFNERFHKCVYRSSDGSISLIVSKRTESKSVDILLANYRSMIERVAYENTVQMTMTTRFCDSKKDCPRNIVEEIVKKQNELTEELISIDKSTGVKNRNAYEKRLQQLNQDHSKLEHFWCVLLDVNHLKQVNDTLGHEKGDELIRMTANILSKTTQDVGEIFRYGGDEFIVFLQNIQKYQLQSLLLAIEKERQEVVKAKEVEIEFAMGYAKWNSMEDRYIEDLVRRADQNMYITKQNMKKMENI